MRTHYCNEVNIKLLNKKIILCGWIDKKKELKSIIFIDIKDVSGKIQCYCLKNNFKLYKKIKKITCESCVKLILMVKINSIIINNVNLEILNIIILNYSNKLPININSNIFENQKLKFRYLYFRKYENLNLIKIRSNIYWYIHEFMKKNNFINIETPLISKPFNKNNCRNYIIPSRLYKNRYYSLSESPQLFKQMLMISGFDKYYQIVKCFRDEDSRSDRQSEFTQLDIEVSFKNEKYIYNFSEKLIKYLINKFNNLQIIDIKKINYKESIEKFGTDKPDLRIPIEIININNLLDIKINNYINIIHLPNGKSIINIENYFLNLFYKYKFIILLEYKNINLLLSKLNLNINNTLFYKISNLIKKNTKNINNDLIVMSINKDCNLLKIMGNIRYELGSKLFKLNDNNFSLVWITDFPMFEIDTKNKKIKSVHHPFTSPKYIFNIDEMNNNPLSILSKAYDLVINGYEVASGSVRINNINIQKNVFNILGYSNKYQENKFGFFLNALKYGTPPHLGIAFGLDRLIMLITNKNNIKDIIAFPKTSSSYDLMINSPDYI